MSKILADALDLSRVEQARNRLRRQGDPIGTRKAWINQATEDGEPTPEQLRKGTYLPPEHSRDAVRPYSRHLDEFQIMFRRGDLDESAFAAAQKLRYHWDGSLGRDVRLDEGGGPKAGVEYVRTYHAQMIADAEQQVIPRQWEGLKILLTETGTVAAVGSALCRRKQTEQARAAGCELIRTALEILALHWGHAKR